MVGVRRTDLHGIIVVDKPEGMTSARVVAEIKRRFHLKKAGHAGTLDPIATGVLPVCINEATKLAGILAEGGKEYYVILLLGRETDTYDRAGRLLAEHPVLCDEREVRKALLSFVGDIEQVAPRFSAKKQDGRPLYKKARRGEPITPGTFRVTLHALDIKEISLPRVEFSASTGKGFYIRSLCHDAGRMLGCGGIMEELRRTRHGPFALSQAMPLKRLLEGGDALLRANLIPLESEAIDIPIVSVEGETAAFLRDGRPIPLRLALRNPLPGPDRPASLWRAVGPDGKLLALLRLEVPIEQWPELAPQAVVWTVERGIVSPYD